MSESGFAHGFLTLHVHVFLRRAFEQYVVTTPVWIWGLPFAKMISPHGAPFRTAGPSLGQG